MTWIHFDVVQGCTDRYVQKRQIIARNNIRIRAGNNRRPRLDSLGRENISLFAIGVVEPCQMCSSVRVVFDRSDSGGNTVLRPHKIDDSIATLVASTSTSNGNAPISVTPANSLLTLGQPLQRLDVTDLASYLYRPESRPG